MTPQDQRNIVRRYADSFNRGDLQAVCQCFEPDATIQGVFGAAPLPEARIIWAQLIGCFQTQLQIESMVAEGNLVAARYLERGRFVAPFRGIQPTNKHYEVVAMEWFEFGNTGIVRRWGARDSAAMFRQLGVPPP